MPEKKNHLLIPLDGSIPAEQPLEVASALADLTDADVHVLFVSHDPVPAAAVAARARISKAWLPRVRIHHARGRAADGIRETARELPASAILLSSHGATGNLDALAGHVTLGVLTDPPCPVYVVRSALSAESQIHRLRHVRRILVPLDGSDEAAQAVADGVALATAANARLVLLYVLCDQPSAARAPVISRYSDQLHHEMEAWRDEFMRSGFARERGAAAFPAEVALRCGDPGEEIVRYAGEEDCDVIITAWGGSLSAGRAQVVRRLLAEAPCPVLFLRADQHAPRMAPAHQRDTAAARHVSGELGQEAWFTPPEGEPIEGETEGDR
jgi:nucleotide-binding universal stress UspA family protein